RDDQLVRITARALHVEEAFAAGTARLVDHHHRGGHQVVLGDDALDHTGHLVGAAAGAGRNNELDRPRRLPRGTGWREDGAEYRGHAHAQGKNCSIHGVYSPGCDAWAVFRPSNILAVLGPRSRCGIQDTNLNAFIPSTILSL